MDAKQNISSIRHFLKKRHWVSDVFAGMCLITTGGELESNLNQSDLLPVTQSRLICIA